MGIYDQWAEKAFGNPREIPLRYRWSAVNSRLTKEEFDELNNLIDRAEEWQGDRESQLFKRWKELDEKVWM